MCYVLLNNNFRMGFMTQNTPVIDLSNPTTTIYM